MKILIINSLYYPNIIGGAEISTKILAEGLAKYGLDVSVVTAADKQEVKVINAVRIYYIKHSNIYWFRFSKEKKKFLKPLWHIIDIFNPFIALKLKKIIEKEKPDIAHTSNLLGLSIAVLEILKRNGIPVIHTIRDYYFMCLRSSMNKNGKNCSEICFECKLFARIRKNASKNVNCVVGVSKFILQKHIENGYFPNALRKKVLFPKIEKTINKKIRINEPLNFLFMGSLIKSKGIEYLLNEFIRNEIKSFLFIAGKAKSRQYENKLKNSFKNPKISFLGFREKSRILSKTDVVIVPSLWNEPLPRVILEAYSFGIPVIVSNRGGIPEAVINGKTGFIFDPEKKNDLYEKIKKFEDNPDVIYKMSDNCLAEAEKHLAYKIIKKYISLYKDTLEKYNKYI